MSDRSKISWTDATWNCVRGCTPVSDGCSRCYASRMASRFSGPGKPYEGLAKGGKWTGKIRLVPEVLEQPLRWRKPRRIFVCSMSDLFHQDVPDEFIAAVFGVMGACPRHTFMILTKRPERMRQWFRWIEARPGSDTRAGAPAPVPGYVFEHALKLTGGAVNGFGNLFPDWPFPNVVLGVSVENQKAADERIPILARVPAAQRFLSLEPLLGPVQFDYCEECGGHGQRGHGSGEPDAGGDERECGPSGVFPPVDHVIVGGESGPGARPMPSDWARDIRDQCMAAGVAYFFKQFGEYVDASHPAFGQRSGAIIHVDSEGRVLDPPPTGDSADCLTMKRIGKKPAGRELDGREWVEIPQTNKELKP